MPMFALRLAQRQLLSILSTSTFFFHEFGVEPVKYTFISLSLQAFTLLISDDKETKVLYLFTPN